MIIPPKDRPIPTREETARHLRNLIDQLEYAVDRSNGKTTITVSDLLVMRDALVELYS